MKYFVIACAMLLTNLCDPALGQEQELNAEEQAYIDSVIALWGSLDKQQGEIGLLGGDATLQVPESFYYLSPDDTEQLLVEIWGNPPGAGDETLGMLFPAEFTPLDEGSWGVTIEYLDDGYVSDEDADEINYRELLSQMKKDTRAASKARVEQGYESIALVGWAAEPFYDQQEHKLHWAKEIQFGEQQQLTNALNYNIRILGRKGVLVLNFIADMGQLELINSNIDNVLALAEFDQGSRYEDFDPEYDKIAAYGIGALVAGKVLAKTGLIAALLIFLKKFGIVIVVGIGALLGRLFKRKQAKSQ